MSRIRASIVIITKNQRRFLERSLPALAAQTGVGGDLEVIVVDSGSTDGAREFVRDAGARLIEYPAGRFSYARAYNLGAASAGGAYLIRLSGDAIPVGATWAHDLIEPLDEDPAVAGTWGRQAVPATVHNPLERWFEARLRPDNRRERRRYTRDITVLGSAMAVRRRLWEVHPFDAALPQAEDYAWMHHYYGEGWAGVYVPSAVIEHGHDESPLRALRRSLAQSALQGLIRLR